MAEELTKALPAKDYVDRHKRLLKQRKEYEGDWKDIQEYVFPRKGMFFEEGQKSEDKKSHSKIIDPEALMDLKDLAAALLTGMTPKSRPWLRLTLQDRDMMDNQEVKGWFHLATSHMLDIFAWSNLYTGLHSIYKETAGFGTGCMLEEEDIDSFAHFITFTAGEYCLAVNSIGQVDTFYREYELSARNCVKMFGEDVVHEEIRRSAIEAGKQDKVFKIAHCIQPNVDFNPNMWDVNGMPFESVYWCKDKADRIYMRSGYHEFPIFAPRWDVTTTASVYGDSPSRDMLGHVKMLQEMNSGQVKAIHKELDPPMRTPAAFKGRLSMVPGAQNVDPNPDGKGIGKLFDMNFDYNGVSAKIEDIRLQLRRGYYIDLLKMLASRPGVQPVTAREIAERSEEKMFLLSPLLERFHKDMLNPLITRTFNMMVRKGMLPPPPEDIMGLPMKIEYNSLLAQAQKLMGLQSLDTFMGFVGQVAQVLPDVLDKINPDEMVDEYADSTGVQPKIILGNDEVAEIRQQRAEQQAQQAAMEQAAAGASAVKDLGLAKTEDTALGQLTEAVQAGGANV
jgi:hypothetical protein